MSFLKNVADATNENAAFQKAALLKSVAVQDPLLCVPLNYAPLVAKGIPYPKECSLKISINQ